MKNNWFLDSGSSQVYSHTKWRTIGLAWSPSMPHQVSYIPWFMTILFLVDDPSISTWAWRVAFWKEVWIPTAAGVSWSTMNCWKSSGATTNCWIRVLEMMEKRENMLWAIHIVKVIVSSLTIGPLHIELPLKLIWINRNKDYESFIEQL